MTAERGDEAQGPVDRARLSEMADQLGGPGLIIDLIGLLFEEAPKHVGRMEEAAEAGDADTLRRAAHTLKSSAGQLAAAELSRMARELEARGEAGEMDGAVEAVAEARREWEAVRADLEELRAKLQAEQDG